MSNRIFFSYRRSDQPGFVGRLYDRINTDPELKNQVFMDIEGIEAGDDFENVIEEQLAEADVVLAFIGDRWLTVLHSDGRPRLHHDNDIVRLELTEAIRAGKRVIPVLIDQVRHPSGEQLPEPLRPLAKFNSLELTHRHFETQAPYILAEIKKVLKQIGESQAAIKKRPWDRTTFLQAAAKRDDITAAKLGRVIDWAGSQPLGFKWGAGKKNAAFRLASEQTGELLFTASSAGTCYVWLTNLQKSGVLPTLEHRETALRKLNGISGIFIPIVEAKDDYPKFDISGVSSADMPRFLEILGQILLR